jgi:PAS domain S-box-containing protein
VTLETLLFAVLSSFAVFGIPRLWNPRRSPFTLWIAGWLSASLAGLLLITDPELRWLDLATHPLGAMFPWLLLAGTLVWADRPTTRPLVLAGLAYGALRIALAVAFGPRAAYAAALALEPPVVLAAAWVAWRHPAPPGGRGAGRVLAVSLVLLAIAGAVHVAELVGGGGPSLLLIAIWLVGAPPLVGAQIQAGGAWMRRDIERARDALELRVRERTEDLARANAALRAEVGERRAAEQALREQEERWRTVSELSSDISFSYRRHADGRIDVDWATDAVLEITGYELEEMTASRPRILHPADRLRVLAELPLRTGGEYHTRMRIVRKDGGVRWMDALFRVMVEPGSVRILGAARDVTEAQEAEEARRRLEHQVQESQRLESLGLLTGGIAHDFNNLLTVILGNARLALAERASGASPVRRLERMRAAAEHGAALTEQMLVYAGRGSLVRKPADLSRLVEDTLELVRASLPARCELADELLPDVWCEIDETQIRQVVLNLATNAGEALGDALGRVTIRTGLLRADAAYLADGRGAPDAAPGDYVYLEIADDGPGIDPATQRRIFDPFFTTKLAGRGLGLAAVLGIVRGHGGLVKVESGPGRGSRFRVLFPSAGQPLVASGPGAHSAASPPPGRSARVLVVDDEDAVLEVAGEFLTRAGFEVETAASGREGIERFARAPQAFAAAVVDLAMPDLSGERVAEALRALRPDVPLVLASGFSPEIAASRCLEISGAGFLRKPYAPDDLVRAIASALEAGAALGGVPA